jgi:hypothetical protein
MTELPPNGEIYPSLLTPDRSWYVSAGLGNLIIDRVALAAISLYALLESVVGVIFLGLSMTSS